MCMPSPGTTSDGKCAEILELRRVRREHDVAQQRDLGMAPGRAVDRADHRHLDFEQPHQQMPALPMDAVDAVGRRAGRKRRGAGGGARPGELGAGAGQDHHPVVAVGADIVKRLGQLPMRPEPPAQRIPLGVQRHLQNALAPLETGALILVCVILQPAHAIALRRGLLGRSLSRDRADGDSGNSTVEV